MSSVHFVRPQKCATFFIILISAMTMTKSDAAEVGNSTTKNAPPRIHSSKQFNWISESSNFRSFEMITTWNWHTISKSSYILQKSYFWCFSEILIFGFLKVRFSGLAEVMIFWIFWNSEICIFKGLIFWIFLSFDFLDFLQFWFSGFSEVLIFWIFWSSNFLDFLKFWFSVFSEGLIF